MIDAEALLEWVQQSDEFGKHFPIGSDIDVALDRRDEPEAERSWLTEHAEVRRLVGDAGRSPRTEQIVGAVAESSFRRAFDLSMQHHEFAAQVSEDLELLVEAETVGYRSETLESLWAAYSSGSFPVP